MFFWSRSWANRESKVKPPKLANSWFLSLHKSALLRGLIKYSATWIRSSTLKNLLRFAKILDLERERFELKTVSWLVHLHLSASLWKSSAITLLISSFYWRSQNMTPSLVSISTTSYLLLTVSTNNEFCRLTGAHLKLVWISLKWVTSFSSLFAVKPR